MKIEIDTAEDMDALSAIAEVMKFTQRQDDAIFPSGIRRILADALDVAEDYMRYREHTGGDVPINFYADGFIDSVIEKLKRLVDIYGNEDHERS